LSKILASHTLLVQEKHQLADQLAQTVLLSTSTSAKLALLFTQQPQLPSRPKFTTTVQLKVPSLSIKISSTTRVESTTTSQEVLLVDTPSRSLDSEPRMEKITGSVLTHGEPAGESRDSSRLDKVTQASTNKCTDAPQTSQQLLNDIHI
jgi:hypothetical protein